MMQVLPPSKYQNIIPLNEAASTRFPLIDAVIEGQQEGGVYVDQVEAPNAAFVYHKFGFSTLLGDDNQNNFEDDLRELFFTESSFPIKYFHWYDPPGRWKDIIDNSSLKQNYKDRVRTQFNFSEKHFNDKTNYLSIPVEFKARKINQELLKQAETFELGLDTRFWSSSAQFLREAIGLCGFWNGELASVCYSTTTADNVAEIDVATLEKMKGNNLGTLTTYFFIKECIKYNIKPNWDCFNSNTPSYKLALKLGFIPRYKYQMFSIYRHFMKN